MLSDRDIINRIENGSLDIDPFNHIDVEPASVDVHLGDTFVRLEGGDIDLLHDETIDRVEVEPPVTLSPGDFILGTTAERFSIPNDLTAQILGRSSLGRLGVSVHQTAGFIDPGFSGQVTLEFSNHGPSPVILRPGLRIAQIVFTEVSSPSARPYGHAESQYQGQTGATPSGMKFE